MRIHDHNHAVGGLEAEVVYKGRIVDVTRETIELGGTRRTIEIVLHPGASAIVPILPNGEVVLIRQYRNATRGMLLEIPAGTLEPDESPEHCALRELREETGYSARELVPLGAIWVSPGVMTEKIHLFLARGLTPGNQELDIDEAVETLPTAWRDAVRMATDGTIEDAKTACALLRADKILLASVIK